MTENVEKQELKPCPFCGGEARRFDFDGDQDDTNFGGSMIECSHCEACTAVEFDFKETLYERWNNRPGERAAVRKGMERAADVAELAFTPPDSDGSPYAEEAAAMMNRVRPVIAAAIRTAAEDV